MACNAQSEPGVDGPVRLPAEPGLERVLCGMIDFYDFFLGFYIGAKIGLTLFQRFFFFLFLPWTNHFCCFHPKFSCFYT